MKKLTLELNLQVTYLPNGVPAGELRDRLEGLVTLGMGDGHLTGSTPAAVETYNVRVTKILPSKKEPKPKGRFHEGTTNVCAHRVAYYYRLPPRVRISKDELFRMTEAAEERAQEMIIQGYVQGELNYETDRLQSTGWWRIDHE
jgi:hypothetical protein